MNRTSLLALGVAAAMLSGCEEAPMEGSNYCDTNADCPIGRVCEAYEHECINELSDGFVGTFQCRVMGPDDSWDGNLGATDVVGWFGGARIALNQEARCTLDNGVLNVFLIKYLSDVEFVYASLAFAATTPGQHDAAAGAFYSHSLVTGESTQMGTMVDGLTELHQPAVLGADTSGYIVFGFAPIQ